MSRLVLKIAVDYVLNGVSVDELKSILYQAAQNAAGRGEFTQGTDAEVDEWSCVVEEANVR